MRLSKAPILLCRLSPGLSSRGRLSERLTVISCKMPRYGGGACSPQHWENSDGKTAEHRCGGGERRPHPPQPPPAAAFLPVGDGLPLPHPKPPPAHPSA